MAVNTDQSLQILKKANKIGVILPGEIDVDVWAAASALSFWATSQNKELQIMSEAKRVPQLQFLSNTPVIQSGFGSRDQFQIKVSTTKASLKELSYDLEPNGIVINLKSEPGLFSPEDVSFGTRPQNYDVLIFLGVKNLDSLGALYSDNTEIFFNTYKINIDISSNNEYYGNQNLVDIVATSICEVLTPILLDSSAHASSLGQLPTSLLAGIVYKTHSFRDPRTSPKTLSLAASLIEKEAKQPEIIQHLYKTKNFSALKLWGRALARIVSVPETKTIHTTLTNIDFEKTGESVEALPGVMKDILENVSNYNLAILTAEHNQTTSLLLAGLPHINLQELLAELKLPQAETLPLVGAYEFVLVHGITERPDIVTEKILETTRKILNK